MFLCTGERKRSLAADNSCLALQLFTVYTRYSAASRLVMARRLTASEALQSVLELDTSSGGESEIEEDPCFPLPTAYSDDESLTPPGSPVHSSYPTPIHASDSPPITSLPVASMSTDVHMNSPGSSPTTHDDFKRSWAFK